MSVEYQQASSIAVVKGVATNSQLANVVKFYTGSVTYDDEPSSKYATVTVSGKTQRVMLCIAVSGTVAYDDSPCLYSTVSGHRCLNITEPTATETPDDIPNAITTLTISGKNYPAIRCILINKTPTYDGVSSTCTFTDDNGKIHTAQLVNQVGSGSIEKIVKGVPPLTLDNAIANSLQYVKAFGGTEQRNLPDGYLQRQFIYMMDESYIDTGIVPDNTGKIEIDFQTTSVQTRNTVYLGARSSASTGAGVSVAHSNTGEFVFDNFGSRFTPSIAFANNTRYSYVFDNGTLSISSGGNVLYTIAAPVIDTTTHSLYINALNNAGTVYGNYEGIYLYSFKVWNAQGVLVADYVPAIQKGTVPVVGFYDTVSGTFKTATAGTFAAGGEAVPTPDTPMDIVCNNGVIKYSANLCDVIPDNIMVGKYISGQGVLVDSDFNFTYIKYIPVKPNTKYTLSLSGAVYFMSMSEYSSAEDAGFVIRKTKYSTSSTPPFDLTYFTLTTGATTNYIRWDANIFRTQAITLNDVLAINWMFNKGDSMPYQPYVEGGVYTDGTKETLQLTGKNLFNWHIGLQLGNDPTVIWTMESGGVTFALNQATGLYAVSGLATVTGGRNTLRTQTFYLPAGTYTISATNSPVINILLVNETTGNTIAQTQSTTTFTLTETTPLHFGLSRTPGITYNDSFYLQIEQGSTATTYEPYYDGGTATAEMLLKVGNYQDVQSVIDGVVTKNVGVKVLDGTENWISGGDGTGVWANFQSITGVAFATADAFCSHSVYGGANINIVNMNQNEFCLYGNGNISFKNAYTTSTANWTQYLADQYAAGTPVIIVYPLATETTDTVTGQPMNTTAGDNTLEITQASLENLEVEVKYEQ